MREFILRAQKAWTTEFDITDLPGAGRIDLVSRCISSAVFLSNDMRRDTIIHVVLEGPKDPPKVISFNGAELKDFYFDEKNIAKIILKALEAGKGLKMGEVIDAHPGVKISKNSFEQLVKEKIKTSKVYYLHEKGKDIKEMNFKDTAVENNITFVFGDYTGVPKNTEKFLENNGAEKINIGPLMLFASHCIIVVHNELDRKELI